MYYTIVLFVNVFGHNTTDFGCNMNEYQHMTYRIKIRQLNNFKAGTLYYILIFLNAIKLWQQYHLLLGVNDSGNAHITEFK